MHINNLNIPNPCSEDIELMEGEGPERYCDKCAKNVYNLSDLTRDEAEALFEANEGSSLCINYNVFTSGKVEFFEEGQPRPSPSQRRGVRKLLAAAALVTLVATQPAILPAKVAVNELSKITLADSPTKILRNIIKAENALLERLGKDFGYEKIEAKYAGDRPSGDINQVTF